MKKNLSFQLKEIGAALLVFISRFGFLPPNFSPLGSFGFFGQNPVLFFAMIFLFDVIRGGFYSGFIFTYIGFLFYYLLGKFARKSTKRQILLLPVASLSFFMISNLGVWWFWYPRTLVGLTQCYLLAVPFYKSTLLGDLVFGYSFVLLKYFANASTRYRKSNLACE